MAYLVHIAVITGITAILAMSLNLVVGSTGLLSVAHAAFYGIGAYGAALAIKDAGLPFLAAMGVAVLASMAAAAAIGVVLSRFDGDYYALASLGFNVIVIGVMKNWRSVTRGPLGIPGIHRPEIFGVAFTTPEAMLALTVVAAVLTYLACAYVTSSPFGRVLNAIREDEVAAQSLGYRTTHYKLAVSVIAAGLAGLAGGLFATYITYIDPTLFLVDFSILLLAMTILGGLGNVAAGAVGAAVLVLLPEALRFLGLSPDIAAQSRQLVYGLLLVLLMRFRPRGLMGDYRL